MKVEFVSDMIDSNGKTVRENNLAVQHKIALGTLVEIIPWDSECEFAGVRLYVTRQTRDCDGTCLYSLGVSAKDFDNGFSEENLRVIR